jgi:hypothetical protein
MYKVWFSELGIVLSSFTGFIRLWSSNFELPISPWSPNFIYSRRTVFLTDEWNEDKIYLSPVLYLCKHLIWKCNYLLRRSTNIAKCQSSHLGNVHTLSVSLFNDTVSIAKPVTVVERSKAWTVFVRSNTGIVDSNPTQDMDICVRLICVCVLCAGSGLATGWYPVQGVLPTLYRIKKLKKRSRSKGL